MLQSAGYDFIVAAPEVDEDNLPEGMLPVEIAQHLSKTKAQAVQERHPDDVVLAADTIVAFGDRPLGKPRDAASAGAMLSLLSGTVQIVITGVTVTRGRAYLATGKAMTAVRMRRLSQKQIDDYVASGAWEGKAGGYGIQDPDPFVTRISGSETNVVGLPMELTREMLATAGIAPA